MRGGTMWDGLAIAFNPHDVASQIVRYPIHAYMRCLIALRLIMVDSAESLSQNSMYHG
jgi:hypothetical protein